MRDLHHRERATTARSLFLCVLILLTVVLGARWLFLRARGFDQPGLPRLDSILAEVDTIPRRQRVIGYERDAFGHGWGPAPIHGPDAGCTTRDAALRAQSANLTTNYCRATGGELFDPYSLQRVPLGSPTDPLEVDHVIPLSAAWDLGAYRWDDRKRREFANDPINLVVTAKEWNQDKSDSLPSEWLPPHPGSRCWYARRIALVAQRYDLPLPADDVSLMRHQCWPQL